MATNFASKPRHRDRQDHVAQKGAATTIRKPDTLFLARYEFLTERYGELEANSAHHRCGRSWIQQCPEAELTHLDLSPPTRLCVGWLTDRGFPSDG